MQIIALLIHQVPLYDLINALLFAVGSVLALVLVALSISSYRKTGLKKLKYVIIAFSLFCVFLTYENLEALLSLDNPFTDIIIPLTALMILIFFFIAVITKIQINQKASYDG